MKSLPKVAVLLATHNPNEFIIEQINSILAQKDVKVKIYWGDFQSDAVTKNLVRTLLGKSDFVEIIIEEEGPAANFFTLLRAAEEDYIAFADQDDIWLPSKLINQVRILEVHAAIPSLVHSNSALLVGDEVKKKNRTCTNHDFDSLAFSNCCQGCTIMINSLAQDIVISELPPNIVWHDWWIAIVISLKGTIFFSNDTEILYRLHDTNLIGIPTFANKVRNNISRESGIVAYQINEAISRFETECRVSEKQLRHIRRIISKRVWTRLVAAVTDRRRRESIVEEALRRLLIVVRIP